MLHIPTQQENSHQDTETNLKEQKSEGNQVNNSHPMNQAPNCRMWPNENPECKEKKNKNKLHR